MRAQLQTWLNAGIRLLQPSKRHPPAPTFMRVAYCTPRQVVLVTTRHQDAETIWPMDWHIPLSLEPKLYGISVNRGSYGAELVRVSGAFVINFVPATWEKIILFCGQTSGRATDKFAAMGLIKEEAETVPAPRLAESLGFLECRVTQAVEAGDHTFFIGEVTHEAFRAAAAQLYHLYGGLAEVAGTYE